MTRTELQTKLETTCARVYYNPPPSAIIKYPCIVYTPRRMMVEKADNIEYAQKQNYRIVVMSTDVDSTLHQDVLDSFDRGMFHEGESYLSDGVYHVPLLFNNVGGSR